MESRIKNEIKEIKKYKPKTKSITNKYSAELVSHIQYLADMYNMPMHKFLVECISRGCLIRADDDTAEEMAKFQSIQSTLKSNIRQAKDLIVYMESLPNILSEQIKHDNSFHQPIKLLDKVIASLESLIQPIVAKKVARAVEPDKKFISAKDSIITIPRLSGINTRETRGCFSGRRIKLELKEDDLKKLKAKAQTYFEYRSYANEEDNAYNKPNITAALIQIIYEAEQLIIGYDISSSNIKKLDEVGTKYNAKMKDFNRLKSKGLRVEPQDLFDAIREIYVAIKKMNIE